MGLSRQEWSGLPFPPPGDLPDPGMEPAPASLVFPALQAGPLPRNFPGGSERKESTARAGDLGSIPTSGRSPGGEHGNPLQCSCLEDSVDRGAWRATAHGVPKSRTQHSNLTFFSLSFTASATWEAQSSGPLEPIT